MYFKFLKKINDISILVCLILLMTNCNNELYNSDEFESASNNEIQALLPGEFKYFEKIIKCNNNESIWQKQLNLIIENDSLIKKNELKLINYKYVRKITSSKDIDKIKSGILANKSFFPIYNDNSDAFSLSPIGSLDITSELERHLDNLISTPEHQSEYAVKIKRLGTDNTFQDSRSTLVPVYEFEADDMGIVDITWEYKNRKINTTCFVSNKKGVVYDNLISNIFFAKEKNENARTEESVIPITIPRLKSGSENTGSESPVSPCGNKTTFSYDFYRGIEVWSLAGIKVVDIEVTCTAIGSCVDGHKSIDNFFNMDASFNAVWPNYASASIQYISFTRGTQGSLIFAWAYAHSFGISVSIGWNGTGFTLSGGGKGQTGTISITPSMLM